MYRFIVSLVATLLIFSGFGSLSPAQAGKAFHPSRIRLLVHGKLKKFEGGTTTLCGHLIPAGNLLGELAPLFYLGANTQLTDWFSVEPRLGWSFGNDNLILNAPITLDWGTVYSWTDVELQLTSKDGYWFTQWQYKIFDWFHAGIEGEGWGNWNQASSWSHGGGFNILFRAEMFGLDLAIHVRHQDHEVKPEFALRMHLFF